MIYLDNAATTKPDVEVLDIMRRMAEDCYANPSALYREGFKAHTALEAARSAVANGMGCDPAELLFTATGTEANNLAVLGSARARRGFADEIVVAGYEHASVSEAVASLSREGFTVHSVDPGPGGEIEIDDILSRVGRKTALVAAMQVNNETGAQLEINRLADGVKGINTRTAVHCDLVQGFMKYPVKLSASKIDTASVSAHKLHGPKGIGALYIRGGFNIETVFFGGGQERGLRSGTSNTALAAAFAKAVQLMDPKKGLEVVGPLNARLREGLSRLEGAAINSPEEASAYILNLSIPGYRSETLLHYLDDNGVMVSSGSSCSKGKPSRTLLSMGLADEVVDSSLRISFSKYSVEKDVDRLVELLADVSRRLVSTKPARRNNKRDV